MTDAEDRGYLGFVTHSRSYYSKTSPLHDNAIDEIMFGVYHEEGGTSGEAAIRWYTLGGKLALLLEMFDDGMLLLDRASVFMESLRAFCVKERTPTCSEVESILLISGFKDNTATARPGGGQPMTAYDALRWAIVMLDEDEKTIHEECGDGSDYDRSKHFGDEKDRGRLRDSCRLAGLDHNDLTEIK